MEQWPGRANFEKCVLPRKYRKGFSKGKYRKESTERKSFMSGYGLREQLLNEQRKVARKLQCAAERVADEKNLGLGRY